MSDRLPALLRGYHPAESARVSQAAAALQLAVASVLELPCAPERNLAAQLAAELLKASGDWYDVVPIVSTGPRLRVPHARPTGRTPSNGELCRIGVRARYGPYHLMCVRPAIARDGRYDPTGGICADVAEDTATIMDALRPGASYQELAASLPPRTGRFPIPLAQGMGFGFKSRRISAPAAATPWRRETWCWYR